MRGAGPQRPGGKSGLHSDVWDGSGTWDPREQSQQQREGRFRGEGAAVEQGSPALLFSPES